MATSVHNQHDKIPWRASRAKRTEALPKHSLFGTALEHYDRESLKDIHGSYIPEGTIKNPPERYPLPDHLRATIPGRDILESSRRETHRQHNLLSEADEVLKDKSEKVFSFKDDPNQRISKSGSSKRSSQHGWLTEKDLEHSKDINIVGLHPRGGYNRDKYGRRPQMHSYSLIGDLLAPKKGDFNSFQDDKRDDFVQQTNWQSRRCFPGSHKDEKNNSSHKNNVTSLIDLPPNIRHKFGSRICDNLLSDQNLVSLALDRQREKSGPPRPSKKENVEALPVNMSDNYTSLGHTTRYNVFPGISSGQTISRTQLEFNDEVHLKRVPNPDEFRYQRDELSIWVEQDVLRKRMEGKWKLYFDTLPQATANWDRSAKRPVVIMPKPSKPKPQPKPKNKKLQNTGSQPNEDDIIFVTPPLTPPPQQEELVELPKTFEKDNEFWSFYDQT